MAQQKSKAVTDLINKLDRCENELKAAHGLVIKLPISNQKTYHLHQIDTMLKLCDLWRAHLLYLDELVFVNWFQEEQDLRYNCLQITTLGFRIREWLKTASQTE